MNVRLIKNCWKLQRLAMAIAPRYNFQTYNSQNNYATKVAGKAQIKSGGAVTINTAVIQQHKNPKVPNIAPTQRHSKDVPQKSEPKIPPNLDILLQKLVSLYQLNGHVSYEQFVAIMDLLEKQPQVYNEFLSDEQAHFLLAACGVGSLIPTHTACERMCLFNRLWDYLARHNKLTEAHYFTQLQVLQHNRTPLPSIRQFLEEITKFDERATLSYKVFTELLKTACSCGNMRQATEVMAVMHGQRIALSEQNFNALLMGHARNQDLAACQTVLDNMTAANVPHSIETQTVLFVAYTENILPFKAADILRNYQGQFNTKQIICMLRSALFADIDTRMVTQLIRELPNEIVVGADVPAELKNICIEILNAGKLSLVMAIIRTLPTPTFNENQDIDRFGVFLLHELFRAQIDTQDIIEFAQLLQKTSKNTRAMHIVTEIATRRSPPTALPFLEILAKKEQLRPHYFWPLMMYNFRRHGEAGILRTLKHMQNFDVVCDRETLAEYVLPRLTVLLENPALMLRQFDEVGLKTSLVLTPILTHLIGQHKLEEVQKLLSLYPTKLELDAFLKPLNNLSTNVRVTKRYQQFARLLACLVHKAAKPKIDFIGLLLVDMLTTQWRLREDYDALQSFLNEMEKNGLTVSRTAIEIILAKLNHKEKGDNVIDNRTLAECKATQKISKLLEIMCNRLLSLPNYGNDSSGGAASAASSFIKHPRDMTMDELECHLIELESKRLNTRGVLRRLLQVCVREGKLERAVEIKSKCDAQNVQVSAGMLASIFDMHTKLKDLNNAELSLKRLQQAFPSFQIDEHKIIDFAALLVQNGQYDAGMELMQQRAAKQKIIGGEYVLKNVWNFLTNVAHLAAKRTPGLPNEQNLTRDTFMILQKLGYCGSDNAALGPIVREYLLRWNLSEAVYEFSALAVKYRHTPLQYEMLSILVRLSNPNAPAEMEKYGVDIAEAQRLLGVVTGVITKVHGSINMNSALLLALAESGTETQLRRLLMNPEFRINQQLLQKNCEHLGSARDAVPTLLRLARAARGLERIIDEQSIYTMILSNFAQTNDYEAALSLFERLEADDDLKISQDFLRQLVNLLKVNNIEIPSGIALRAQVI